MTVLIVTTGWNFNQSRNKVSLSNLALNNIEALASGEGSYIPGCNYTEVTKKWEGTLFEGNFVWVCTGSGGFSCCPGSW